MTIEIDHAADEYARHLFDVVNGVQELGEVREVAFAASEGWARILTKLLKGSEEVSKRHLLTIYSAMGMLENSASRSNHEKRIMEMAGAIRLTFGLILSNECHEDWNPRLGTPPLK